MSGSTPVGALLPAARVRLPLRPRVLGLCAYRASPPCAPFTGFLYTPQQLAGSMRFGSGVLLGNWREDDALDEMRMMDHTASKETQSLTLLKKQRQLAPQLVPVPLSPAPADNAMHVGDTVLLQSLNHGGEVSVSMGQQMYCGDAQDPDAMYTIVGAHTTGKSTARNAIKFTSYEPAPAGSALLYGQKVCLEFAESLGVRGRLASMRSGRQQLSTQIINKQEVFMQAIRTETPPYDCAWFILPADVDERIIANGTPVIAGAPFVLVHCFTNKRLAGVNVSIPTDFGTELGLCVHTYTETGKVNKLMRETVGRPTANLISRTETTENLWSVLYA